MRLEQGGHSATQRRAISARAILVVVALFGFPLECACSTPVESASTRLHRSCAMDETYPRTSGCGDLPLHGQPQADPPAVSTLLEHLRTLRVGR
jgi:hypothetical protein